MNQKIGIAILSIGCIGLLTHCNLPIGQAEADDVSSEFEMLESEIALEKGSIFDEDAQDGVEPQEDQGGPNPALKECLEVAVACRKECVSLISNENIGDAVKQCQKTFKECIKTNPDNKPGCRDDFGECRNAAGVGSENNKQIQQCMSDCKIALKECVQSIQ